MAKGKFITEFKEFINRGNVMDLAVGVIIGGAFQGIISSLVDDVVMPVIGLISGGTDFSKWSLSLGGEAVMNYGNLIAAIINFLLISLVVFGVVKAINSFKKEEATVATTKQCPHCCLEIPLEATRCGHCTSELSE